MTELREKAKKIDLMLQDLELTEQDIDKLNEKTTLAINSVDRNS